MKKIDIYKVLDIEIAWCKNENNQKNLTMPKEWREGFIEGLKQAKRIIKATPIKQQ